MTGDDRRRTYQRARRPAERDDRRRRITEAVRSEIAAGRSIQSLTVTAIARTAGLSPAGLYTYYRGRESILLDVLAEDLDRWLGGTATALDEAGPTSAVGATTLLVDQLAMTPTLPALLTELTNGIETAAVADDLAEFKRRAASAVEMAAAALDRALPGVDGHAALRYVRALVIGLWAYGTPDSATATATTSDAAHAWFDGELRRALAATLTGLLGE